MMTGIFSRLPAPRRFAFAALLGAAALTACATSPPAPVAISPFVPASSPLDPSDERNWGGRLTPSASNERFAAFVRHAEGSPDWLQLSWRGEAVYARVNRETAAIRFQDGSNKIESIEADGGVEALSMRMYTRADELRFNLAEGRLALEGNGTMRRNSFFPEGASERGN